MFHPHPTPPSPRTAGADYAGELKPGIVRVEVINRISKLVATFNLDALRVAAGHAMNSECTNAYHIATGGFNAVYILTFSDGREAIARLNANDVNKLNNEVLLRDRVRSEAATLRYVREHCAVPVPQVFAVNDVLPNPVGARYILEERILGHPYLHNLITEAQRTEFVTRIFEIQAEFIRTRFTEIGSIYQCPDSGQFYIGPMVPSFYNPGISTSERGPWTCTRDWLKSNINSELAILRKDPKEYREVQLRLGFDDGDPPFAYHVALLETLLITMDKLQYLQNIPPAVERPVPQHNDLTCSNVLVSYENPEKLLAVIDFEGTCVVPLWSAMDAPAEFFQGEDAELTASWWEIRKRIFSEADPAWEEVEVHRNVLLHLRRLVFMRSIWTSIESFHQAYENMKKAWPVDEPGFADLDELVALGPGGYTV